MGFLELHPYPVQTVQNDPPRYLVTGTGDIKDRPEEALGDIYRRLHYSTPQIVSNTIMSLSPSGAANDSVTALPYKRVNNPPLSKVGSSIRRTLLIVNQVVQLFGFYDKPRIS